MFVIFVLEFIYKFRNSNMGRKEIERTVHKPPLFKVFKPTGVAGNILEEVVLSIDEYESIRLVDYCKHSHEEAADEMSISRPVFTKMLEKARYKLSTLLVRGALLKIDGGNFHFKNNIMKCLKCEQLFEIEMDKQIVECPNCGNVNIMNIAGAYGHGRCCINNNKRRL
jgi:predicted DNA-binding protein (UPF0251 family)